MQLAYCQGAICSTMLLASIHVPVAPRTLMVVDTYVQLRLLGWVGFQVYLGGISQAFLSHFVTYSFAVDDW